MHGIDAKTWKHTDLKSCWVDVGRAFMHLSGLKRNLYCLIDFLEAVSLSGVHEVWHVLLIWYTLPCMRWPTFQSNETQTIASWDLVPAGRMNVSIIRRGERFLRETMVAATLVVAYCHKEKTFDRHFRDFCAWFFWCVFSLMREGFVNDFCSTV